MTNEKQVQDGVEEIKRVKNFFIILLFGSMLSLILDIISEYRDYKAHPDYYIAPYPTLQDHLELDLIFHGVVIFICLIVWIVLKIVERKRK